MTNYDILNVLTTANGKELLLPEKRQELIALLHEKALYSTEMQALLLCLSSINPAALLEQSEITLVEYQNMLRTCIQETKLQYEACAEHLSVLLKLCEVQIPGDPVPANEILSDTEPPEMKKYYSYDDVRSYLSNAAKKQDDPNTAASLYAELMRADVTEAYYQYGNMSIAAEDDDARKKGEKSLLTAASRGNIPAALRLGDYYMSIGKYAQAQRFYCRFGGAALNEERRNHVFVLELIKRSDLRTIAAQFLFMLLCAGFIGFLLLSGNATGIGKTIPLILTACMLGCAGFSVIQFLRNPLVQSKLLFFIEIFCFLGAVGFLFAGMDVTI